LLKVSHQLNEAGDKSKGHILGQALVLPIAKGCHGIRLATGVELVGVGNLLAVAASHAL
jgi:hypothetical protein